MRTRERDSGATARPPTTRSERDTACRGVYDQNAPVCEARSTSRRPAHERDHRSTHREILEILSAADDEAIVLGHEFWRSRFAGDLA